MSTGRRVMSLAEATAFAQQRARMSVQEATEWAEGYVVRRGGSLAQSAVGESSPVGVTFTADQFAQVLERVATRAAAAPVRESAPAATPAATSAYGYPAGWPDKPLHEFTADERERFVDTHLVGATMRHGPAPLTAADMVADMNRQHA